MQHDRNDLWMISSTSWTPDEDLNMLVNKMKIRRPRPNDETKRETERETESETKSETKSNDNDEICILSQLDKDIGNILARLDGKGKRKSKNENKNTISKDSQLVLFITGKDDGSLKAKFIAKYNELALSNIRVIPLWLEDYESYVHLLRYCDLGLCFHDSSSGLDLPMKVVDMFGVGIPVIAKDYSDSKMYKVMQIDETDLIDNALSELVSSHPISHARGFIFGNPHELYEQILRCYRAFIGDCNQDEKRLFAIFRRNINMFRKNDWDTDWKNIVQPLFNVDSDLRAFWTAFYCGIAVIVASACRLYYLSFMDTN